jgi:hypothetical protein
MSSLRRFVQDCLHLRRTAAFLHRNSADRKLCPPRDAERLPNRPPNVHKAARYSSSAHVWAKQDHPGRHRTPPCSHLSEPCRTSQRSQRHRPQTDRGSPCHRPFRQRSLAMTGVSCSRAPRRPSTWASHWPPFAAGQTPGTSVATALRAGNGASPAPSSTSSSPRCSTALAPDRPASPSSAAHRSPEPAAQLARRPNFSRRRR